MLDRYSARFTDLIWQTLGYRDTSPQQLRLCGEGYFNSAFPVTELACASLGSATLALAELRRITYGDQPCITLDRRLTSLWFGWTLKPIGWQLPDAWDAIAGDYPTRDGWIRLHTNAPHHRAAVEQTLGVHADKAALAKTVSTWDKHALEQAVVANGGCAAEMLRLEEWQQHRQGKSVAQEALIQHELQTEAPIPGWPLTAERPLAGIRVLDLTRILAGPIATRFLAGYGADVLRIDPFGWEEPVAAPEVTLGKRCARLNLTNSHDRRVFEHLLAEADVIVHGYRAGALDALGYDAQVRQALSPGLVDVCLNAYGWSGPWRERRGFDSLVQMSCGIAEYGMRWQSAAAPVPLPVQALDHATGYLMATAVIHGLIQRQLLGTGYCGKLSLARTALLLTDAPYANDAPDAPLVPLRPDDYSERIEETSWGPAQRLQVPLIFSGVPLRWTLPASQLGSVRPEWLRR